MTRVIEYVDPIQGCSGSLVYDRDECRLAAGGCRMQRGVTKEALTSLAARMTLKQRVLGLNVDGAKCGIDYDPHAPSAADVLRRFLDFLRSELSCRFSMGSDMGTRFEELSRLAGAIGIPSIKYAVKVAQEFTEDEFARRLAVLGARVGTRTVSERRAGHALAHATMAAVAQATIPRRTLGIGLQGFGNLGRAAAESLAECGARVVAVADEFGCVLDPRGLPVGRMVAGDPRKPVSALVDRRRLPRNAIFELPLDVLVLAATEDAMAAEQAAALQVPVVVVGANYGLNPAVEELLTRRGVLVIPDFIGGAGGSASMEALFGPEWTPSPEEVLGLVATLVTELVRDVLSGAKARGVTPSRVAMDMAAAAPVLPGQRPYGATPYLSAHRPRGNRARRAGRATALMAHQEGGTP